MGSLTQEQAVALPARNHRISLVEAAAHTRRHREAKVHEVKAGAFHKDQVLELLNQAGCVGLRVHLGRNPDGSPTVVLTGIDATDSDLVKGSILEQWFPCPPICGAANALQG
jgi:hypothetical protein